jgi:hypothetical protein
MLDLYPMYYVCLNILKPSDIPEQRPMYWGSIGETKAKFREEIEKVMERIAIDAYNGETFSDTYILDLEEPRNFFYKSLKGPIPITSTDVRELIMVEVKRQESFYSSIKDLADSLPRAKVLQPNQIVEDPHWEHKPSYGCNIRLGSTVLYAYPRLPSSTEHFLTLNQGPIPANIIHVDEDYILMLPYGQDLSKEIKIAFKELSGNGHTIKVEEFEEEIIVNGKFFYLLTEEKVFQKTLDKILEIYGGLVFQVGRQSNNTSYIHTGLEESLPRLWSTIYFEWKGNWMRHQ